MKDESSEYFMVTRCIHCGSSQITDFWEGCGVLVVCWSCGHRLNTHCASSAKCAHCGNPDAIEFFDERDGVNLICPTCRRHEISGLESRELPRLVECPQCGNTEASEFDDYGLGILILCLNCGREELKGPIDDCDGTTYGWKHEIKLGAGCFKFRTELGMTARPLHTVRETIEAEQIAREKLAKGEYIEADTSLRRWNPETRQSEIVIGRSA
jgi:hypothetical protein